MTITTEEAERFARWCDTEGFKASATALRSLAAERDALRAENARLREALLLAIDTVEFWAAYASPNAQERHDLAGDFQKLRAALGEKDNAEA
jgi:hypothetical protein